RAFPGFNEAEEFFKLLDVFRFRARERIGCFQLRVLRASLIPESFSQHSAQTTTRLFSPQWAISGFRPNLCNQPTRPSDHQGSFAWMSTTRKPVAESCWSDCAILDAERQSFPLL